MTIEQIMQLSQAGFTAEQITALAPLISAPAPAPAPTPAPATAPAPAPAPATAPTPAPAPAPAPAPTPATAPAPAPAGMTDIMQQLAALTSAVHAANIRGNDNPNTERSMADIAASILDPNPNK